MKYLTRVRILIRPALALLLLFPLQGLFAQQEKIAAFKEALAENQKKLKQYQWIETTTISMKGEVKSQVQKLCSYGPDGKVQKQQIGASPQQATPGGVKGKVVEKKKAEMKDYMESASFLVQQYVPPDSQRIQAAQAAGNLSLAPGAGGTGLNIRNYLKPGDSLNITINNGSMAIQHIAVKTYMASQQDKVTLDIAFAAMSNGVDYPAKIVLLAPAKELQVAMQNANYQMIAAAVPAATPPAQQGPAVSAQQIDALTAPIALYPDALVAQILEASTNPTELQSFAGWMTKNASLHGDALQDAASKAGFATCYVALAPFTQVVQMMVQKIDWATQLGQAFTSNQAAVFDSIQRLRAKAASAGTLKTNQQQTVVTQTASTGETVIVIQPTNPQVVYVPTYNPQTVYVQDNSNAAAAAIMGFTAGVIITATASNHYYYGPYAWNCACAYYGGWQTHYNYAYQRQDIYQQNAQFRQDQYQKNSQQRQQTYSTNQATRQETYTTNQSERQTQQQANQANRQSSASTAQSNAQANQATRQSNAQANQSSRQANASFAQGNAQANQATRQANASSAQSSFQMNQASRQSSASTAQSSRASTSSFGSGQSSGQRSGMSSGGFSGGGYQSGANTRSESSRGNSSLSSMRSSGGASVQNQGGRRR